MVKNPAELNYVDKKNRDDLQKGLNNRRVRSRGFGICDWRGGRQESVNDREDVTLAITAVNVEKVQEHS